MLQVWNLQRWMGHRSKNKRNNRYWLQILIEVLRPHSTSKTVDGKTTFGASMRQTTEEDRQKFFAENPQAAQLLNIKDQFELDSLGADMKCISARPQKLKQGGFVSGPGGVDKVPARLTAGEFVMSKGAVQKYGVRHS